MSPAGGLTRRAALVAVMAAILALGSAGLVSGPACLLAVALAVAVRAVRRLAPALVGDQHGRSGVALVWIGAVVLAASATADGSGLPAGLDGLPVGPLAAGAAGALAASVLELGHRRGVLAACALSAAVLGLAAALAPDERLLPAFVIGWPAVLLAPASLAVDGGLRPGHAMTATAGGVATRWRVLPVVWCLVLTAALVAVLGATGAWSDLNRLGPRWAGSGGDGAGGPGERSARFYLGSSMDLRDRGDLGDAPLFRVPAASPVLWRAGTMDVYDGRGWRASGESDPVYGFRRTAPDTVTVLPEGDGGAAGADGPGLRTDVVEPLVPWLSDVLAPGQVVALRAAELRAGAQVVRDAGDRLYLTAGGRSVPTYRVTSAPRPRADTPEPATQGAVPGADAAAPAGRWTELPPGVPERVLGLGRRLVRDATGPRSAALAVEEEIRARMTYRLDSPVPPRGVDAVDHALFTARTGYCEQFASAAVVLLRAGGIPARIATGFAGGEVDGATRVLREKDAHAWVEVWDPALGWVSSDPTAGATPAGGTDWRALFGRVPVALWSLLAVVVVVLLVAAGFVVRWRRNRPAGGEEPAGRPRRDVPAELMAAFARLDAALAVAGTPRGPGGTPQALARRLADDDPGAAQALAVLERALYAAAVPSRAECADAAAALDRAATALLTRERDRAGR